MCVCTVINNCLHTNQNVEGVTEGKRCAMNFYFTKIYLVRLVSGVMVVSLCGFIALWWFLYSSVVVFI